MYTFDLEFERLEVNYDVEKVTYDEKGRPVVERPKTEAKRKRTEVIDLYLNDPKGYQNTVELLHNDDDYTQMRQSFTKDFFDTWKRGFNLYIEGKWEQAHSIFMETKVSRRSNRRRC